MTWNKPSFLRAGKGGGGGGLDRVFTVSDDFRISVKPDKTSHNPCSSLFLISKDR